MAGWIYNTGWGGSQGDRGQREIEDKERLKTETEGEKACCGHHGSDTEFMLLLSLTWVISLLHYMLMILSPPPSGSCLWSVAQQSVLEGKGIKACWCPPPSHPVFITWHSLPWSPSPDQECECLQAASVCVCVNARSQALIDHEIQLDCYNGKRKSLYSTYYIRCNS